MAKQPYTSGRSRAKGAGSLGRLEQPSEDDRPFAEIRRTLHDALRMLTLHRWAFFVPFSLVTCAAFILSLYYPRTYTATTSFERRNDPVMMNLPMSAGAASFKYFRNTMARDLTSIEYMSEVVENLNLIKDLKRDQDGALTATSKRQRNALARSLAARLHISTATPSEHIDIIQVTYTGPDPTIGRRLVDEVKRTYIRRTMAWIHEFLTSQRDYFTQQAQEALAGLNAAKREETRLRLENPLIDPANPETVSLRLAQLEMEHRELLLRQRGYQAELAALEQLLAATPPVIPPVESGPANHGESLDEFELVSRETLELATQVRQVEGKIEEFRTTRGMTDQHPEIRDLLARHRRLSGDLKQQRMNDLNTISANVPLDRVALHMAVGATGAGRPFQTERMRLLVQIAAQKAKLKDVEISLGTNETAAEQMRQAKRKVYEKQEEFAEATGSVFQASQRQRQLEVTLSNIEPAINAIEQGRLLQFSEGQPARGSVRPVSPRARSVLLLALMAGISSGIVMVILAEVVDHVYRSSGQVARTLGLPMLESIDEIITSEDRRHLFVRKAVLTPLIVVCFIGLVGLTGSMAYLSIEQPWTYQKIRKIPEAAVGLFALDPPDGKTAVP